MEAIDVNSTWVRKATCIEKLYVALADNGTSPTFRYLIRVDQELPVEAIEAAVQAAVSNCPAANLKFSNDSWYFSDYLPAFTTSVADEDDVVTHPISEVDCRKHTLKVSSLYHRVTDTRYIAVEFFHGACDGLSALHFIYDIFAALDKRALTKYTWNMTDIQVVKKYATQHTEKPDLVTPCLMKSPAGPIQEAPNVSQVTVPYRAGGISGKLSYAIAQVFGKDSAQMMIPVNMRAYIEQKKDEFMFGNLAAVLFCRCGGKTQSQILSDIKHKLATRAALSRHTTQFRLINNTSLAAIRFFVRMYENLWSKKNRYAISGMISHLGPVDESRLLNPHCRVTDVSCQLNYFPLCGFILVSICFGDKLNVSIRCNPKRTDAKTLHELHNNIRRCVA